MSKDPAFLFYPNDYLGGTMGMTFEEKGAYMELLMLQFNRGHMTEHMIGHTVGKLWLNIKDKFTQDDNGLWFNSRLDEEKAKRMAFTQSRRNNKKGINQHTIGHMTSHMENENENRNEDINTNEKEVNIDFEFFWIEYDKKVGDKKKLIKKWNNLTDSEREKIMEYLPSYKQAVPDKQFRKNPETFFNNKSWLDEIVTRTNAGNGKQSYAEREFAKLKSL